MIFVQVPYNLKSSFQSSFSTNVKCFKVLRLVYDDMNLSLYTFFFINLVPPEFTKRPDRFLRVMGKSDASIPCRAFGFPPPTIVWSRGLLSLPKGRTSVTNHNLTISNFSPEDAGVYQCKAGNKLGIISALTTLNYVPPGQEQIVNFSHPLINPSFRSYRQTQRPKIFFFFLFKRSEELTCKLHIHRCQSSSSE